MPTHNKTRRAFAQRKYPEPYQWLAKSLDQVEETAWSEHDLKIRAIGRDAFKRGGRRRMRIVWEKLYDRGIIVGNRWEGIGGWYA
jgi:hypothetical protein